MSKIYKRNPVILNFDPKVNPSRTKQSFKDECDVNKILDKYKKTQQLTHVNKIEGTFGDFTDVSDYQSSLNAVMDAQDRFMGLSSSVRARFGNDPAQLIKFISDSKNMDEAIDLGLIADDKAKAYLSAKEAQLAAKYSKSSPDSSPQAPSNGKQSSKGSQAFNSND